MRFRLVFDQISEYHGLAKLTHKVNQYSPQTLSSCMEYNWQRNQAVAKPNFFFLFFFWPHSMTFRILIPWPGIERRATAVKVPRPNHWTTKEVPQILKLIHVSSQN